MSFILLLDMSDPLATLPPSSSVGDYVKAIWEIAGSEAASTKDVAARLSVSSASVTNMFGRLQEMGLAEYERYRGASLTVAGRREALRLVRRHRLIETFLLEHLGYSWQDVHEEAERLEHAVSDEFTERLAEMLGHPGRDPHGDPIPAADGTLAVESLKPLGETEAGQRVSIVKVDKESASVLNYLGERGLVPGCSVKVREVRALDGVVTVEDEGGVEHALGESLARAVFVQATLEGASDPGAPA
ncbi:MAG: metal-dependent transcriptional regulator [Actinomycetota bacterium]|nr:metal-dependent transcriptional regulator [Actinomycetota bacterium]